MIVHNTLVLDLIVENMKMITMIHASEMFSGSTDSKREQHTLETSTHLELACTLSEVIVPSGSLLRKSMKYFLVDSGSLMNSGETVGRKERSLVQYSLATCNSVH